MLETVTPITRNPPRFSALRLVRRVSPPFASVLLQVRSSRSLRPDAPFVVRIDGRSLPESGFERIRVDGCTVQLIVHGENFSWVSAAASVARLEVLLENRVLLDDGVEVAPFQR